MAKKDNVQNYIQDWLKYLQSFWHPEETDIRYCVDNWAQVFWKEIGIGKKNKTFREPA